VAGNTTVDNVCKNVLRLLKVSNRDDIPVFIGAHKPLVEKLVIAPEYQYFYFR
jgi:inosine-uridine nucleoside N-ribohydrolase